MGVLGVVVWMVVVMARGVEGTICVVGLCGGIFEL